EKEGRGVGGGGGGSQRGGWNGGGGRFWPPPPAAPPPKKPGRNRSSSHKNHSPHRPRSARDRGARRFICASGRVDLCGRHLRRVARRRRGLERQAADPRSPGLQRHERTRRIDR